MNINDTHKLTVRPEKRRGELDGSITVCGVPRRGAKKARVWETTRHSPSKTCLAATRDRGSALSLQHEDMRALCDSSLTRLAPDPVSTCTRTKPDPPLRQIMHSFLDRCPRRLHGSIEPFSESARHPIGQLDTPK